MVGVGGTSLKESGYCGWPVAQEGMEVGWPSFRIADEEGGVGGDDLLGGLSCLGTWGEDQLRAADDVER